MPKPTKTRCLQASYEKIVFLAEASDDARGSVMTCQSACPSAGLIDVRITIAGRSLMTCVLSAQRNAGSRLSWDAVRTVAVTDGLWSRGEGALDAFGDDPQAEVAAQVDGRRP